MVPIENAKVKVHIDPDASHSCNNWFCCFGCKCVKKISTVAKVDSPVSVESVERITRTYERHRVHHTPSPIVRSREIEDLSGLRKMADVDLGNAQ